ncbi:MAG TPA: TIGR00282 family metallophosphoesterase [Gemmataceae bacterium]|nr:TIGR00282 family metallophosphoesterase [Gemmataceae bacterium]
MKVLFIGDVVGKPGVRMVQEAVPALRAAGRADFVIANAENAAHNGSGCTPADYRRLRDAGVDLVTLGDHVYKKAEIIGTMEQDERICKPANFPPAAPGHEYAVATTAGGVAVAVFCLLGRTFMRPADDPYVAADRVLTKLAGIAQVVIVDMHAEATADKYLMANYLNGRVAAVIGTHTHVPTADEQVFDGGTAFICDVGMTGPYAGILGRRVDRVLGVAVNAVPAPFEVATDDVRLGGAMIDVDPAIGRATRIERVMITAAVPAV